MDHFRHPRNMGEMKNPDVQAQVGNSICGDIMKIYLKINKNKKGEDYVKEIKFQTLGCAAAIATTSALTELVKGKTLKQALGVDKKAIAKYLGGLPPIKLHCSILSQEALRKAIKKLKLGKGKKKVADKIDGVSQS